MMENNDRLKYRFYEKRPTGFYIRYEFDDDYIIQNGQVYETYYDNGNDLREEIITCQCTGLKDKNGVLIYEGDIIESEYSAECFIAKYYKGAFCGDNSNFSHGILGYLEMERSEIIGNIYENADLLK